MREKGEVRGEKDDKGRARERIVRKGEKNQRNDRKEKYEREKEREK